MKIKVGAHTLEVMFKDPKDMDGSLGMCFSNDNVIHIRKGMPKSKEKEVLLHECLHAIDEFYGIGLGEKKVNILAMCLLTFFKENRFLYEQESCFRAIGKDKGRKTGVSKHTSSSKKHGVKNGHFPKLSRNNSSKRG